MNGLGNYHEGSPQQPWLQLNPGLLTGTCSMGASLTELLTRYRTSHQMGHKKLAAAAGLNASTVERWVIGENAKLQRWQDLAKIARVLSLDRAQTNELLMAGGQPSLTVLERRELGDADRMLFARWPDHLLPSGVP